MSKRFFEGAQHAARYALTRPTYPKELIEKIIEFLGKKVFRLTFSFAVISNRFFSTKVRWISLPISDVEVDKVQSY